MSGLMKCGICCFIISIWGFIQLSLMGIFYYNEVVTLLEDVEEEEYEDYDDFIKKTEHNYFATARNCWIASFIYAILIGVSYGCIIKARKKEREEALNLEDDEYVCTPKPPPKTDERKIK